MPEADFSTYFSKSAAPGMAGVFGESWTRYSLTDGSIVSSRDGGSKRDLLQSGSGTTVTAHLAAPLDGQTILNVDSSDAVARGDVVFSPDSHRYEVDGPIDDAHTSWVVRRTAKPVA